MQTTTMQVRIDADLQQTVRTAARENARTVPKEVNHVLRGVYRTAVEVPIKKTPMAHSKRR